MPCLFTISLFKDMSSTLVHGLKGKETLHTIREPWAEWMDGATCLSTHPGSLSTSTSIFLCLYVWRLEEATFSLGYRALEQPGRATSRVGVIILG